LFQFRDAGVLLVETDIVLEQERQALQQGVFPEGQQRGTELVLAAQLRVGVLAGEQLQDHLGLELGREAASCATRHEKYSFRDQCSYRTGLTEGAQLSMQHCVSAY
jgi:hypothetical protein